MPGRKRRHRKLKPAEAVRHLIAHAAQASQEPGKQGPICAVVMPTGDRPPAPPPPLGSGGRDSATVILPPGEYSQGDLDALADAIQKIFGLKGKGR